MRTITEKTIIKARPEDVWKFLTSLHLGNNYHQWHPQDHIKIILIAGDGSTVGSRFYIEEYIGKFILRLPYLITQSVPSECLEYTASFPLSIFNLGMGYFKIKKTSSTETELTAYVQYGYNFPILGKLIDWLIELFVKVDAGKKHIHEEGLNMKKILEI